MFEDEKKERQELLERLPLEIAAIRKLDDAFEVKKKEHKKEVDKHQGRINEIMEQLSDADGKQLKLRPSQRSESAG